MPQQIKVCAHAKLNLFLHVTGKRADGYHMLDSLVVFTAFGDVIEVQEHHELSLVVTGACADAIAYLTPEENLVWKAAKMLQATMSIPRGARITLRKNIPVGAGIGGGSADAAAVMHALCRLWKLQCSQKQLRDMGLLLGSDVPVCLAGTAMYMSGIGEQLTPVPLEEAPFVLLVNPNISLATQAVFQAYAGAMEKPTMLPARISSIAELLEMLKPLKNSLQGAAMTIVPEVATLLVALQDTPDCLLARMSGSGATCFGLYENEANAHNAQRMIRANHPTWWSMVTHIQTEREYG